MESPLSFTADAETGHCGTVNHAGSLNKLNCKFRKISGNLKRIELWRVVCQISLERKLDNDEEHTNPMLIFLYTQTGTIPGASMIQAFFPSSVFVGSREWD